MPIRILPVNIEKTNIRFKYLTYNQLIIKYQGNRSGTDQLAVIIKQLCGYAGPGIHRKHQ